MNMRYTLAILGNIIGVLTGVSLATDYGWSVGLAVGYVITLLADIRFEVTKP